MAGKSSIWRIVGTDPLENAAGTDEIIEFNEGIVPNTTAHIKNSEDEFDREPAENEKASGNINELQDVGLKSITVIITGHIQTPSSTTVTTIIKKWMIERHTVGDFTKGRFGLRRDDNPINNLTPTTSGDVGGTRGYFISNFKLIRPPEFQGKMDFVAVLRFNGTEGATPYAW